MSLQLKFRSAQWLLPLSPFNCGCAQFCFIVNTEADKYSWNCNRMALHVNVYSTYLRQFHIWTLIFTDMFNWLKFLLRKTTISSYPISFEIKLKNNLTFYIFHFFILVENVLIFVKRKTSYFWKFFLCNFFKNSPLHPNH